VCAADVLTGEQATNAFARLAARLGPAAEAGRKVLLGERDPAGASCVRLGIVYDREEALKPFRANPAGGPGTRITAFWLRGKRQSAVQDHDWQQGALRAEITGMLSRCRAASLAIEAADADARRLARAFASWRSWPEGLKAPAASPTADWAGVCLSRLTRAVAARDLPACRRWSAELASATFAVADLQRWLAFLLANHLEALDFQADLDDMPAWADRVSQAHGKAFAYETYKDYFAPSALIYGLLRNLQEVERQAERLYAPPATWLRAGEPAAPGAVWVPPDLRTSYGLLRGVLSGANQGSWDRAAAGPFDRSYLTNILFRMTRAGAVLDLAVTLKRFDRTHPAASVPQLMDAVFYRGEPCSGLVWRDRFDRRLMQVAGRMPRGCPAALRSAQSAAHGLFGNWSNYAGRVWSLRHALDRRKLDCLRATDLIAALYRNAGHAGVRVVHLSCGVATHTMAAAELGTAADRRVVVADPFAAPRAERTWPGAFYGGYAWPKGYPGDLAPPFTAELSVRGLDNYVFAEGYVIRGPKAGTLIRAAVPYLPGYESAEASEAFTGPYPEVPSSHGEDVVSGPPSEQPAVQ